MRVTTTLSRIERGAAKHRGNELGDEPRVVLIHVGGERGQKRVGRDILIEASGQPFELRLADCHKAFGPPQLSEILRADLHGGNEGNPTG